MGGVRFRAGFDQGRVRSGPGASIGRVAVGVWVNDEWSGWRDEM